MIRSKMEMFSIKPSDAFRQITIIFGSHTSTVANVVRVTCLRRVQRQLISFYYIIYLFATILITYRFQSTFFYLLILYLSRPAPPPQISSNTNTNTFTIVYLQ